LSTDDSNGSLDCAKEFGLKEIPFEPLGTETGKYPIIRSSDFDELIRKAHDSRIDRKTDVVLVRAPQGAGKTAISSEVNSEFKKDPKTTVISTSLINMKPSDLTRQIIVNAIKGNLISENFPKSLGYESGKQYEDSQLKEFVIKIFEESMKNKTLGIWIVDEFDTISSSQSETDQQKVDLLQWIRAVIDSIANSNELKSKKGFLIIMAHTEKSSEEFAAVLKKLHGPAHERIMSTGTIDIGYSPEEAIKIVKSRLSWARIDNKLPDTLKPFTDDAIRTAYERINQITGTRELISFRLFERTLFLAIKDACKQGLDVVDTPLIEKAFQKVSKTVSTQEESRELSLETRTEVSKYLRAEPGIQNVTILSGIKTGIENFMDNTISQVSGIETKTLRSTKYGLTISEMRLNVTINRNKASISIIWYCISKDKESFEEKDFRELEIELKSLSEERRGINLSVLSLIADKGVILLQHDLIKNSIQSVDSIIIIDDKLKRVLISLACCKKNEVGEVRGLFEQKIKPQFEDLLYKSVNDVTFNVSPSVIALIQMLNILKLSNNDTSGPTVRAMVGNFFNKAAPSKNVEAQMTLLGFAKESTEGLIPTTPKSFEDLKEMLHDRDLTYVKEHLNNSEVILSAAKLLGILNENNKIRDVSIVKEEILTNVEKAKTLLKDKRNEENKVFKNLQLLCSAFDEMDSASSFWVKLISLIFIKTHLAFLLESAAKISGPTKDSSSKIAQSNILALSDTKTTTTSSGKKTQIIESELITDAKRLLSSGPMTLSELTKKLIEEGYPEKVKGSLNFCVIKGQLRLTS